MAEILLLEDLDSLRLILADVLRDDGHEVVESSDGVIAYDKPMITRIDVMLTDLDMPRVNGIEAILAAQKIRPDLKIIAMSGAGTQCDDDYLNACTELGVSKIMLKPFDPQELTTTVRGVLGD